MKEYTILNFFFSSRRRHTRSKRDWSSDVCSSDLDGLGVLAKMREAALTTPVIVQTAHGGIDNVVTAMRAGATDFVVKPVGAERLQVSLRNALAASALEDELARIKRSRTGTLGFRDII